MPPLLIVQADPTWVVTVQNGRFDVESPVALSQPHLQAALTWAQERMIADLGKRGKFYVDRGFAVKGPLPHFLFSEHAEADPGVGIAPDPLDLAAVAAWEKAERARSSYRLGLVACPVVDYVVAGYFRHLAPATKRVVGGSPVWYDRLN